MKKLALQSTTVSVEKSIFQIEYLVGRMGATGFSYKTRIDPGGQEHLEIAFQLNDLTVVYPINIRKIFDTLKAHHRRPPTQMMIETMKIQAKRIAARQLYEMVRVILLAVEYGLVEMKDAFLANILLTAPSGDTMRVGDLLTQEKLVAAQATRLLLNQ